MSETFCVQLRSTIITCWLTIFAMCCSEKVTYFSLERPYVNYFNPNYITYINLTSRRVGRKNPVYYTGLNFDAIIYFGNNLTIDFYFFEFLSNRYQRNFVEMHFKFCDMVHNDPFFGEPMRRGGLDKSCPYPPGSYRLSNMTVPAKSIPRGFPFKKGRILANLSIVYSKDKVKKIYPVTWLQIDMELKEIDVKRGIKV